MSLVKALGKDWKDLPASEYKHTSFINRAAQIPEKLGFLSSALPEYLQKGGKSVVDFSSGNGVLLEILRYHGHDVLGVDLQYFGFLKSQGIPSIYHDCRDLPFPLTNKSCELITCIASISTYGDVHWGDVVSEFARIAKECIVIRPNSGSVLNAKRHQLENWAVPGWKRRLIGNKYFKWVYDG